MRPKASWTDLICRTHQHYHRQWMPNIEWPNSRRSAWARDIRLWRERLWEMEDFKTRLDSIRHTIHYTNILRAVGNYRPVWVCHRSKLEIVKRLHRKVDWHNEHSRRIHEWSQVRGESQASSVCWEERIWILGGEQSSGGYSANDALICMKRD